MAGLLKDVFTGTLVANYTTALSVTPQNIVTEVYDMKQEVIEYDDENVTVITHSGQVKPIVKLQWDGWLSSTDTATIIDFWTNTSKAKGRARTFYWAHPLDTYTYVARFLTPLTKLISNTYKIQQVTLKIEGVKA